MVKLVFIIDMEVDSEPKSKMRKLSPQGLMTKSDESETESESEAEFEKNVLFKLVSRKWWNFSKFQEQICEF